MTSASELKVDSIICLDRTDCDTLIGESHCAGSFDSWSNIPVACNAEILDLLRHEVVDGHQGLGVKVDTLIRAGDCGSDR